MRTSANALKSGLAYAIEAGQILRVNTRFLTVALMLSTVCFASSLAAQQRSASVLSGWPRQETDGRSSMPREGGEPRSSPSHRGESASTVTPSYLLRYVLEPLNMVTNIAGSWVSWPRAEYLGHFRQR